jgi:hypothetical protein
MCIQNCRMIGIYIEPNSGKLIFNRNGSIFMFAFRLEIGETSDPNYLQYIVQSTDESSLVIKFMTGEAFDDHGNVISDKSLLQILCDHCEQNLTTVTSNSNGASESTLNSLLQQANNLALESTQSTISQIVLDVKNATVSVKVGVDAVKTSTDAVKTSVDAGNAVLASISKESTQLMVKASVDAVKTSVEKANRSISTLVANGSVLAQTVGGSIPANANRKELIIENSGASRVYILFTNSVVTVNATNYSISLAQFEKYSILNRGGIRFATAAGSSTLMLTQIEG